MSPLGAFDNSQVFRRCISETNQHQLPNAVVESTTPDTIFASFPQEILEEIAGHLHDEKDTLLSLSKTCRAWNIITLPLRFTDMRIEGSRRTPRPVYTWLENCPRVQQVVRTLYIIGPGQASPWDIHLTWVKRLLHSLPRLKDFSLLAVSCSSAPRKHNPPTKRVFKLRKLALQCDLPRQTVDETQDAHIIGEILSMFDRADTLHLMLNPRSFSRETVYTPMLADTKLHVEHLAIRPPEVPLDGFLTLNNLSLDTLRSLSIADRYTPLGWEVESGHTLQMRCVCATLGHQLQHLELEINTLYRGMPSRPIPSNQAI